MTAPKPGGTWVGRSIRRLEDPPLVAGGGRFTADLKAAHWGRLGGSPVACGRIEKIAAPAGAQIVTAADLADVRPIRPMLHKFGYIPVGQPVLASGVVRFVGEPVAAVVAESAQLAEDIADEVELVIAETPPVVDARTALADGAPAVPADAPRNVIREGQIAAPNFEQTP